MFPADLIDQAMRLLAELRARKLQVATAESCTGGMIAGLLTEIPGSSDVVERGFVTYSNAAKTEMIGVPMELIVTHGAVSEAVARAMASGALAASHADISIAVTGVAGPGGGSAAKPVGLVHFGGARKGGTVIHHEARFGDLGRGGIRLAAVRQALQMIGELAD